MTRGIFIVLEGADGSGKTTQFNLLAARLKAAGYDVEVFDFPRYDQPSSHFVRSYLNREYGPADKVGPYTASLFYALDRYEAAPAIREALAAGKIVLSDRYVGANMAHQGSKLSDPVQQRSFFVWEDSLEFQLLGIPRPDVNLFLRVPAEVSNRLIEDRGQRRHEHENDLNHMRRTVETYDMLCRLFPKDFKAIESTKDGKLLVITEISDRVWQAIKPLLPAKPPNKGRSLTLDLESLTGQSVAPIQSRTETSPESENKLSLSKVSLLANSFMTFENGVKAHITHLLWPNNPNAYYTPAGLSAKIARIYKESITKLAGNYKEVERQLAAQASKQKSSGPKDSSLKGLLPMAALCDVEISGSDEALQHLAQRLAATNLDELVWCANQIEVGLNNSGLTAKVSRRIKTLDAAASQRSQDFISKLVKRQLPGTIAAEANRVTLLESWPRNEFEIMVDSVYSLSDLSRGQIEQNVEQWKYEDKKNALQELLSHNGSLILEQVHYKFDVIADQRQLAALIRSLDAESLRLQTQTPRYGYEVPRLIEQASLEDTYQSSFDESLRLFSSFQAAELESLAPYSTLMGHKLRGEFIINGRGLAEAITDRKYQRASLLSEILEKVAEVHPLIAESLAGSKNDEKKAKKPSRSGQRRSRRPAARRRRK